MQPYLGSSADVFNTTDTYGPIYRALTDSMNGAGISLAIHSGDVKSGSTLCNDFYYNRFRTLANSINVPMLLTLGDNGWTDCHRANNGGYDPLNRLALMRQLFYQSSGINVLGKGVLQTRPFPFAGAYPENQ